MRSARGLPPSRAGPRQARRRPLETRPKSGCRRTTSNHGRTTWTLPQHRVLRSRSVAQDDEGRGGRPLHLRGVRGRAGARRRVHLQDPEDRRDRRAGDRACGRRGRRRLAPDQQARVRRGGHGRGTSPRPSGRHGRRGRGPHATPGHPRHRQQLRRRALARGRRRPYHARRAARRGRSCRQGPAPPGRVGRPGQQRAAAAGGRLPVPDRRHRHRRRAERRQGRAGGQRLPGRRARGHRGRAHLVRQRLLRPAARHGGACPVVPPDQPPGDCAPRLPRGPGQPGQRAGHRRPGHRRPSTPPTACRP